MKRRFWKTLCGVVLAALMLLPLGVAFAVSYPYYTGIFIYKYPDKMEYEVGESLNTTGMIIKGYCLQADGKTQINTLGTNGMTISPKTFTQEGWVQVTITLQCKGSSGQMETFATTMNVHVNPIEGDPPLYWTKSISATATKTDYTIGESIDLSTITVWAYSEGDYPPEAAKWDCTGFVKSISPMKFTKLGEQYVTITANLTTYEGTADFTTKLKVNVRDKIKITKDPKGETVTEGDSCYFTVKGENYDYLNWYFAKGKTVILGKFIRDEFPKLKVSGIYEKKLKLSHIPLEMDGWSVYCEFITDAETVETKWAEIHVLPKETPTPKPTAVPDTPAPAVTPETSTAPTEGPSPDPVVEASVEPSTEPSLEPSSAPLETPASHTHSFDGVYRYDEKQHWLECTCGEKTAVANHVVTEWKVLVEAAKDSAGVRKGTCAVCGAEVIENYPYEGKETGGGFPSWLLYLGIGLAGAAVLGIAGACTYMVLKKKKGKNDEEE